ncbi:MAG TPA: hypothetical protein VGR93_08200 [Candidatus Acidoferrales bacterium]|nr:hypothetical protein [Candidatus Acidoferrales bacterium]
MSYTGVGIEQTWVNRNWWCADCRVPTDLDRHGRCGSCGSDAVDMMSRPNKQGMGAGMQPGSIVLDDLPQFARLS